MSRVKGIKVKNYGPVVISGSGTNYTITLARRIKVADRVTITITAPNFVTYIRRLDVLPGDFDDNGVVNNKDVKGVSNELHQTDGAGRRSSVTSLAIAQSTPGI